MPRQSVSTWPQLLFPDTTNTRLKKCRNITENSQSRTTCNRDYLGGKSSFFAPDLRKEIGGIEGVIGLKYTAADLFPMQIIQQLSRGRLDVWCGHDQMALPGLLMNAIGIIGSSYNYIPEISVELYDAYVAGNSSWRRVSNLKPIVFPMR